MREYDMETLTTWRGHNPFSEVTAHILNESIKLPSAAWVRSIYFYSFRMALFLDGFEELLNEDEKSCLKISAALIPSANYQRSKYGKWEISGTWKNISGIKNADKVLLKGNCEDKKQRFFLIDKNQYKVEDCWDTVGLRETESEAIKLHSTSINNNLSVQALDIAKGHLNTLIPKVTGIPMIAIGGLTFLAPLSAISDEISQLIMRYDIKEGEQLISQLHQAEKICRHVAEILDGWNSSTSESEIRIKVSKTAQDLRVTTFKYIMGLGLSIWNNNNILGNRLRDIMVGTTHPALQLPL